MTDQPIETTAPAWVPPAAATAKPAAGVDAAPAAASAAAGKAVAPTSKWTTKTVAKILIGASKFGDGTMGERVLGPNMDPDLHHGLQLTDDEARDLAEPLVSILNARPALAALASSADIVAIAAVLMGIGGRYSRERARNLFLLAMTIDGDQPPHLTDEPRDPANDVPRPGADGPQIHFG